MLDLDPPVQRPHRPTVGEDGQRQVVRYGDFVVFSVFEPILSVSHMRAVGYQACLQARERRDEAGAGAVPLAPQAVFAHAARQGDLLELGRLMQSLHLANFCALSAPHEWLFLNLHPVAFSDLSYGEALVAELKMLGLRPQRVVIEVPEQFHGDAKPFFEAVDFFRRQGFLIALDDFGARHSNIDRIWQLQPDIVKLDQRMSVQVARMRAVERVLPGLVALLHESGRLVLMSGIDTERQALIAMESGVDFVQGAHFAPAALGVVDAAAAQCVIERLSDMLREQAAHRERVTAIHLQPYLSALESAAVRLVGGDSVHDATADLLALPDAARCFMLDARGRQLGDNLFAPHRATQRSNRFVPLLHSEGASWERRPYFLQAIAEPGRVQMTRPYLSINEAHLCVTLSVATRIDGALFVLCADIDWEKQRD